MAAIALVFTAARGLAAPVAPTGPKTGAIATGTPVPATIGAEISILHATNGKRGIDPRIGNMPELTKPPFSSYSSYVLLKKVRLPLRLGDAQTFSLPNGRLFQTKLLQVLANDQLRISASIEQPGGGSFLPLLEVRAKKGQAFIVAGQSYKAGTLVLVIRVGA
jgi:hypothetical protein